MRPKAELGICMEIEIDFNKSAQKNAEDYFEKSKKSRRKAAGAEKAVSDLEASLAKIGYNTTEKKQFREIEKKEWYEKFNWFFTSEKDLAIGGRSADQNEEIYSKYLEKNDLFFHSDIFGASVVVLKNGTSASAKSREEAAQFAGCFSSAWENLQTTVDVYSLRKEQVSKSKNEGSISKGSFTLSGEREWYKNMPLEMGAFLNEEINKAEIAPMKTISETKPKKAILIKVGKTKKSDAAKYISKELGYPNIDYIMQHLPTGPFSISEYKS
jgi:predicted ribosome quality control (RQC) complex YloA/Tae2 family protein